MESVFVHLTVVPTATVNGLVPNAVVVRPAAPEGIDTFTVVPVVVVVVVEDVELGEEEELPQAAAAAATAAAIRTLRKDICLLDGNTFSQIDCPIVVVT